MENMDWNLFVNSLMVIFTATMAGLAYWTIYQNRKDKQEVNRANIVAYFETEGMETNFIVQNVGLTNAYDVKIEIDKLPLPRNDNNILSSIFDHKIATMPPSFKTILPFGHGPDLLDNYNYNIPNHNIEIKYKDIYKKKHVEKYPLSLNYVRNLTFSGYSEDKHFYDNRELKKTLNKTNREIKDVRNSIDHLSKNIFHKYDSFDDED